MDNTAGLGAAMEASANRKAAEDAQGRVKALEARVEQLEWAVLRMSSWIALHAAEQMKEAVK